MAFGFINSKYPYNFQSAKELLNICKDKNLYIYDLILLNELISIDDENLYKLNKNLPTSINVKDNKIVNLFRGFCI